MMQAIGVCVNIRLQWRLITAPALGEEGYYLAKVKGKLIAAGARVLSSTLGWSRASRCRPTYIHKP